jgi:methylenetetrahydrofolate reductase (NADPH)
MMTNEELKAAIVSFLGDYSIEATPADADKLDSFGEVLEPGTAVYVAHPPGLPIDDVLDFAVRIKAAGFEPVPHVIARKLTSKDQLERALARLQEHEIGQALVVAGDEAVPGAAFDSSLEVLQTGLFDRYGFEEVGVAGHPEGSSAIGAERVDQALRGKAEFARSAGFKLRVVTQFGFDPESLTDWERETSAAGIELPIHVGMAGPASLRQLLRFAMLCGIGSSAKMLTKRTGAAANLLTKKAPDELITYIARHRTENPSSRLVKAHFFAFGGLLKTAGWANTVRAGQFTLNSRGTGFDT